VLLGGHKKEGPSLEVSAGLISDSMLRLLAPKEEFTFKRNSIWQIVPNNYLAIKPKNGGSLKKHISDESRWIYLDFKFVELDFTALSITLRILNLDATKVKSLN